MVYLIDLERTISYKRVCFWKGNRYGYTFDIKEAGVFGLAEAYEIVTNDLDNNTVILPVKQ